MEQDEPSREEGAADARAKAPAAEQPGTASKHQREEIKREAIKQDYLHGGLSVARIARKHRTTIYFVRKYAEEGAWVRQVETRRLKTGPTPGVPRPRLGRGRVGRIRERLYRVLDEKMRQIEERMADQQPGDAPQSAADAEREARSLAALARLYAQLVEIDEKAKAKGSAEDTKLSGTEDDAESLRRELALRFERLRRGSA
jgi:hypothetical protein